ncbi:MAG: xanthine phosphoribosyltransferase [Clostridiales bacterium]|nr:xanthine phosphoribosyltransferase [Clostridiales bacterium]
MEALKQAIRQKGRMISDGIVKVDSFLNHRLETGLLFDMGAALARRFSKDKPDLVLTVEASGIALAMTTAHALGDIPVVFAKKGIAANQSPDMAEEKVYSFTHQCESLIRLDLRYIPAGSRVLIVDDFLANGKAIGGLMSIIRKAGAQLIGVGIAIEKGFQPGGKLLREQGIPLLSLAVIDEISDAGIRFRDTDGEI